MRWCQIGCTVLSNLDNTWWNWKPFTQNTCMFALALMAKQLERVVAWPTWPVTSPYQRLWCPTHGERPELSQNTQPATAKTQQKPNVIFCSINIQCANLYPSWQLRKAKFTNCSMLAVPAWGKPQRRTREPRKRNSLVISLNIYSENLTKCHIICGNYIKWLFFFNIYEDFCSQ